METNITIVAGLILALAGRFLPKRWSVWAAIIILGCYAVMAGASPSVVRAAIMGALAMVSRSIGRNRTAVNSLGLAAAGMVLHNPLILRDIGFQLSVAATAGILLIGVPVNEWFVNRNTSPDRPSEINTFTRIVGDSGIITIAAQLATLPFLLYHFHRYPLIGLLVNPCVLPVQPAAMILGGLAALAGMIWLPLGQLIGWIAWVPLVYTTRVVEWFSNFRGLGLINMHMDLWLAAVFTLVLILAVILRKVWMNRFQNLLKYFLAGMSIFILVVLVNALYLRPDGRLHIQVFRQGSDLSSFIVTPGGQRILVTNRPGDKDLVAFVDRRLPMLQKRLDAVIIPNATSSTSISMGDSLSRFQPEWLLINEQAGGTKIQSKLTAELIDGDLANAPLETGQRFDLGRGAELSIRSVDAKGSRMAIIWGGQAYELLYGSSLEINTNDRLSVAQMDVSLLDHPADNLNFHEPRVVLDAKNLSLTAGSQVTIMDGNWLEICSDGEIREILEKANDAS
jgi:competence protein ComEC